MRGFVRLVVLVGLLYSSGGVALAAPAGHHVRLTMNRLTVAITTTSGTVWGSVHASWISHGKHGSATCSRSMCHMSVPHGATVTLKQQATNTATWPFKDWTVKTGGHVTTRMGTLLHLTMMTSVTVTAVYVLHQNSSSGYP